MFSTHPLDISLLRAYVEKKQNERRHTYDEREHAYKYITRPKKQKKIQSTQTGPSLYWVFFIIDRKYCFDTAKDFGLVFFFKSMSYTTREI